jgi:hypothetical protein
MNYIFFFFSSQNFLLSLLVYFSRKTEITTSYFTFTSLWCIFPRNFQVSILLLEKNPARSSSVKSVINSVVLKDQSMIDVIPISSYITKKDKSKHRIGVNNLSALPPSKSSIQNRSNQSSLESNGLI